MRNIYAIAGLSAVYLLASVRYFPGQTLRSVHETTIHMLSVAPVSLGFTLIIAAVLQKMLKERLPFSRTARIFLVSSICLEFLLGLAHYFTLAGGPTG